MLTTPRPNGTKLVQTPVMTISIHSKSKLSKN
jgi:hypothetical protein